LYLDADFLLEADPNMGHVVHNELVIKLIMIIQETVALIWSDDQVPRHWLSLS
jgi:hypothetical protein